MDASKQLNLFAQMSEHERTKSGTLLLKIFENILKYPKQQKYRDLNFEKISKRLQESQICIDILFTAGFEKSKDGQRLLLNDSKSLNTLKLLNTTLSQIISNNTENNNDVDDVKHASLCDAKHVNECDNLQHIKKMLNEFEITRINKAQYIHESTDGTKIVNNFLHLLKYHNNNEQFEQIFDVLGGYCDASKCGIFRAHYRDQISVEIQNNNSKQLDAVEAIFSKIHCHYKHSYDVGVRLTNNEIRQMLNDDDDAENKENEQNDILLNRRVIKINRIISIKKRNLNKMSFDYGRLNRKYNQFTITNEAKNQSKPGRDVDKIYSYGKEFIYQNETKEVRFIYAGDDIQKIMPKYESLKEEVTGNKISIISMNQYNAEYEKAEIYFNSEYKKKHYDDMEIQYILSLMIYCNFTELQNKFSCTYRENIETHNNFHHLGRNLKVVLREYGTMIGEAKIESFYHGISEQIVFPRIVRKVQIYCPLSTSSSFSVASNFADNNGLIVEFGGWAYSPCKYFSVSWLSDYSNEAEHLFVQCQHALEIIDIVDTKFGYQYNIILEALKIIDAIMTGFEPHISSTMSKILMDIVNSQLSSEAPQQNLSEYAKKLIAVYFKNKKYVRINYENEHFWSLFKPILNSDNHIRVNVLETLFPNMEVMDICHVNLCETILNEILQHKNKKLRLIEILFNKNSELTVSNVKNKFGIAFKELGFDIIQKYESLMTIVETAEDSKYITLDSVGQLTTFGTSFPLRESKDGTVTTTENDDDNDDHKKNINTDKQDKLTMSITKLPPDCLCDKKMQRFNAADWYKQVRRGQECSECRVDFKMETDEILYFCKDDGYCLCDKCGKKDVNIRKKEAKTKVQIGRCWKKFHFIWYDTFDWEPVDHSTNAGMVAAYKCKNYPLLLSINYFAKKPDIPHPSNMNKVRNSSRESLMRAEVNGAIIKSEKFTIDGIDTVEKLIKIPGVRGFRGMMYIWSITIPFKDRSYVIKCQAREVQAIGLRDTMIGMMRERGKFEEWAFDPYDPSFKLGQRMNRSELEEYDEMFPLHPLSVLRKQIIPNIKQFIRFEKEVHLLSPF